MKTKKKKNFGYLIAYLIPLVIILYILYTIFLPFGYSKTYTVDIGVKGDTDKTSDFYLQDNVLRLSPTQSYGDDTFREFISNDPIYFNFNPKIIIPHSSIMFKMDFESSSPVYVTVFNPSLNKTEWKMFYNPSWENYTLVGKIGEDNVYVSNAWLAKNNVSLNVTKMSDIPKFTSVSFSGANQNDYVNDNITDFKNVITEINTTLRGSTSFYVYLNNSLNISIVKQDLNWYNGSDVLNVTLYDMNGNLIFNDFIGDDGYTNVTKNFNLQNKTFVVDNVSAGLYFLKLIDSEKSDITIRKIKINTNKIVTLGKLLPLDNVLLYTEALIISDVGFNYWHNEKNQTIIVKGDSSKKINLKAENISQTIYVPIYGKNTINITVGDVWVFNNLNFAFNKNNFFNPFVYYFTNEESDFIIRKDLTPNYKYINSSYISGNRIGVKADNGTIIRTAEMTITR